MIVRLCICIPTFNNPQTVAKVARETLERTRFPVLIIDDGSDQPVRDLLGNELRDYPERLSIFRSSTNQGKGLAIQRGFSEAVKMGFTHMLTMDGDGQHLVSETESLIAAAVEHPWALIVGNRKFPSQDVPGISKFGRNFSNIWVDYSTGQNVGDSQSGHRVYPLFFVQNMSFWTTRFDFEIEVMIRLLWKGVEIKDVSIDVHYPPPGERVSHFHKFKDNVRITFLYIVLIAVSLLRSHNSPLKVGFAVGLGILIGCTPLIGLHTLIVASLGFLLRLNVTYLWLGSQVSLPFLLPFVIWASVSLGRPITGIEEGSIPLNWAVGSLALGTLLGSLVGTVTGLAVKRVRKKKAVWSGKSRGGVFGNWIMKVVVTRLGRKPAYWLLYFIVPYFYIFAPKARRSSNEYWKTLRPELNWYRRQIKVLKHLLCFAKVLVDRLQQSFSDKLLFSTKPRGMQNIMEPINSGEGLILLTAHIGAWDLAAAVLHQDGFHGDLHVVNFEARGMTFEKIKGSAKTEHLKPVSSNRQTMPILKIKEILDSGKPVGLMGDRPLSENFELIPFFGKLAAFDATAFRIAAGCKKKMLMTFGFKGSGNGYEFHATPSRYYEFDPLVNKHVQILLWSKDYVATLEKLVKRYPYQWFNFFPFWSVQPASTNSADTAKSRHYLIEELNRPANREFEKESDSRANASSAPLL
jgi:predicted LPLAT superfamily acyltransferase/uncharacterized protein (DUF2062 family)